MNAVDVEGLSKYYRSRIRGRLICALKDATFSVPENSIFGIIGANGAGKSTTIKILTGLIRKSGGSFKIFGEPLAQKNKSQIGYLPETLSFYGFLNAYETLIFYAKLCGISKSKAAQKAVEILDKVGLANDANRPLREYSKGMLQRVAIAQAIIHSPRLVVLDEPASGLDPIGAADMRRIILDLRDSGKTVLLSSHQMGDVEKLCDGVVLMAHSQVRAKGALGELLKRENAYTLDLLNSTKETALCVKDFAEKQGCKVASFGESRESLGSYFERISRQ